MYNVWVHHIMAKISIYKFVRVLPTYYPFSVLKKRNLKLI